MKIGSKVSFTKNNDVYYGYVISFDSETVSVWYYDNTGNKIGFFKESDLEVC